MVECCEPKCLLTRVIPTLVYTGFALSQWNEYTLKYAAIVLCLEISLIVGIEKCIIFISICCGQQLKYEIHFSILYFCVFIFNLFTPQYVGLHNHFFIVSKVQIQQISEWIFIIILFSNLCIIVIIFALLVFVLNQALDALGNLLARFINQNQNQQNANQNQSNVEALEPLRYADIENKWQRTCPICLMDFYYYDQVSILQVCGHYFHSMCIQNWLSTNQTCPCCRQVVHVN